MGVVVLLLGYHLALAVRYRLFGMIPLILGVQVGLWLVAEHVLRPSSPRVRRILERSFYTLAHD